MLSKNSILMKTIYRPIRATNNKESILDMASYKKEYGNHLTSCRQDINLVLTGDDGITASYPHAPLWLSPNRNVHEWFPTGQFLWFWSLAGLSRNLEPPSSARPHLMRTIPTLGPTSKMFLNCVNLNLKKNFLAQPNSNQVTSFLTVVVRLSR